MDALSVDTAAESPIGMERIAFQVQGRDRPGVTQMMVDCLSKHENDGLALVDVSQIIVSGFLMESFVCDVKTDKKYDVQKDLLYTCQENRMEELPLSLQWSLIESKSQTGRPTTPGYRVRQHMQRLSMQVVVKQPTLQPEIVHRIGIIAKNHNANIISIEQEEITLGTQFAQSLHFRCVVPHNTPVAKELFFDLQKCCWKNNAECVVRQFDTSSMAKPKQRSLVVFGLSNVLINSDILDDMVNAWLTHPECTITKEEVNKAQQLSWEHESGIASLKLNLLKGAPEEIIEKTRQNIVFTKNARQVCGALKHLGYKMALITSTTPKPIATYVSHVLGLDYVLCHDMELDENQKITGMMINQSSKTVLRGESNESRMRKEDGNDGPMRKVELMRLLADKEKVDKQDIIVVGNYVHRDTMFEHAGFQVHYNSTTFSDMSVMLYLFGFNMNEVLELLAIQNRMQAVPLNQVTVGTSSVHSMVKRDLHKVCDFRIIGPDRTGVLGAIMEPLSKHKNLVSIARLSAQAVVCGTNQSALVLAFQVSDGTENNAAVKDILFEAKLHGMQAHVQFGDAQDDSEIGARRPRLIVSVIKEPRIRGLELVAVLNQLHLLNVNIDKLSNLSTESDALAALELSVTGEETEPGGLLALLQSAMWGLSQEHQIDIAVQNNDVARFSRRVIVFDMDSTLIQQEVIDELARYAGVVDQVSKITEAAMRGEINFADSLRQRCALLAGQDAKDLFDRVKQNLIFTPGAKTLCRTLKRIGFTMAVISGGFLPLAHYVQKVLQLDYAFANELETDSDGLLTGKTMGSIVTPQRKRMLMSMICEVEGCTLDQVIAVGDGANDIPMLQAAGLGVAFCAKPRVQEEAQYRINNTNLRTVAFLLGIPEANTEHPENDHAD